MPKQEDANRVSELKKMSLSNYLVSKASMCVIAGNGIIGHNVTQALNMLKVGMEYNDLQTKNGEVQSVNIFLCPFDGNTPDVSLRHEIRHALTSSAKITNNGIEEVKIGNDISQYNDSTLVDRKYTDFNEVYTQKEAIDETIYSWNHGQYLINKPGDKLKLGNMSSYDYWIPRFQVIYDALPSSVKRSQIEDDNNSLYEFIPESVLSTVEELITDISVDDEEAIKRLYSIVDELKRNEEASIQL